MRILVLGGTRFFGLQLVHRLVEEGHQVTVLTRGRTPASLPPSVERLVGDRQQATALREAVGTRTWDVVIDNIGFTAEDSRLAIEVFAGRTKRFLFTSTAAVYSCLEGVMNPYREDDTERLPERAQARGDPRLAYGFGKLEAERVLQRAYREQGFPVTILRLPVVIGPRDHTLRAYSYWVRLKDHAPLILPDGGRTDCRFIFSGDVVRAFLRLLEEERSIGHVYNFAQEEIVSVREFVKLSAEILETGVETVDIPLQWLRAQGIAPTFSPYSASRSWILDISKAQWELGWRSTPWREWMRASIEWFEREYQGPPPENYFHRAEELQLIERWRRMTAV
ncbi:MAG: NAD-dependent epimerase/dehydratase family protein [Blastocatellia bacterium]|nr:NAD-dependent epimerase/dehydratase family protein [Blastocatellia bacterium]